MKKIQYWHLAEVQVTYQTTPHVTENTKISSSHDAESIFRLIWSKDIEFIEEFNALFLTRAHRVKGFFKISRGGTSQTILDPKVLFATALKGIASAVVVAHNHPSGILKPSKMDIVITKQIRALGELLDMPVIDHLILAPHAGYYSFADEGII